MAVKAHLRLGDILLKEGLITEAQLQKALHHQKSEGKRLGETLLNLQFLTEGQLAEALARQLGIPYRQFSKGELTPAHDPELKKIIPEKMIRAQKIFPLAKDRQTLTVALTDPLDLILLDNLKKMTRFQINPVIATETDLVQAINAVYGKEDLLKEAVAGTYSATRTGKPGSVPLEQQVEILTTEEQAPTAEEAAQQAGETQVVRLVDLFLIEAINSRASDIHIEPQLNQISIRFRIDGALQPVDPPAPHLMLAFISRIKILAKMDIAEKRLPQDGGFAVKLGGRNIDLRVSTIPVVYGEKVVIRLLDKSSLSLDFKEIGLEGRALEDLEFGMASAYGLVFITGPTGSGKSTTLYAVLNRLKNPAKNIVTIEDPVEYKMEGINQVQAKPPIGLTFAAGLRAFLRQDPDIIMVGEVRDLDTAEICVRAALTGHLVLSTLHTNDAASAITRLIDLGIEPFLLSPSLVLVIAQRLIRKLCADCRQPHPPLASLQEKVKLPAGHYFRAKGCPACRNSGYQGRIGIFEVMKTGEEVRELVARGARVEEIKEAARNQGMKTLLESGLDKAAAGLTSLEEVFGVTVGKI